MLTARLCQKHMKWVQDWTMDEWKKVAKTPGASHRWPSTDIRLATEAVAPECIVRQTQASSGRVMRWVLFTWDTIGIIISITQFLTAVRYLNIVAYQVPCQLYSLSVGAIIQKGNATLPKMVMEWFKKHDGEFVLLSQPPNSTGHKTNRKVGSCSITITPQYTGTVRPAVNIMVPDTTGERSQNHWINASLHGCCLVG